MDMQTHLAVPELAAGKRISLVLVSFQASLRSNAPGELQSNNPSSTFDLHLLWLNLTTWEADQQMWELESIH